MPELPEVEFGRRTAERVAVGRTVVRIRCARDPIVFAGFSPQRIHRALVGRRVTGVERRGKYIWFALDRRPWPVFHFGMTGAFRVPDMAPLRLEASPRTEPTIWPPRFTKIHLWLDDGGELVMTNARRLGRIRLREDPEHEPPISTLGFDPYLSLPSPAAFRDRLHGRRTPIKALLLDQGFAAGVGNWIADQVLYQAGIDPRRRASALHPDEAERIRRALGRIVRRAVRVDADKQRFPKHWLFHYRWGRDQAARTPSGARIHHVQIGGRTTAWVPQVQA